MLHKAIEEQGITFDMIPLSSVRNLREIVFNKPSTDQEIATMVKRAMRQDLRTPVILDPDKRILFGHLSILKAMIKDKKYIRVWAFKNYRQMQSAELTYTTQMAMDDLKRKTILPMKHMSMRVEADRLIDTRGIFDNALHTEKYTSPQQ
jgi:hypothetical protein